MSKAVTEQIEVDPLLTLDEVASILRLHRHTVRKLIGEGRLRFTRIGGQFRFKRAWVEDSIENERPARRRRA